MLSLIKYRFMINSLILIGVLVFDKVIAQSNQVAGKTSSSTSECQLTFGWTNRKPMQFLDENGQLQGIQIDLVKSIALEIGCKLNFVQGNWKELLDGVKGGQIDFMPGATKTEKRSQFANFSLPYRRDVFVIYVRKAELSHYHQTNLEELKNSSFKLAFTRNFLYGTEVETWQKNEKQNQFLSYADNTELNIKRLYAKQIDGFLEDPYVISYQLRSRSLTDNISKLPFIVIGHPSSFIFSKKNISDQLISRFNRALKKLMKTAKFQSSLFALEEP